jgi:hypothetical protein
LKIDIDDDERIAFGGIHARGNGELVPEVARKEQYLHALVLLCDLFELFRRSITAAVVHINDLILVRKRAHRSAHALV